MIRAFLFLVFLLLFGIGITIVAADESSIPDLIGNWTGTSYGYHSAAGYFHAGDYQYILKIGQQEERVFNGTLTVSGIDPTRSYPFSGIIAHDMKTLHIAEYGTGEDIGYLISPDELELILMVNDLDNFSVLCTLKRE